MKMIIKYISLFLISLLFLSGCGWSDIQKKYSDVLNEGIDCEYTITQNYGDYVADHFHFNIGYTNVVINDVDIVKDSKILENYYSYNDKQYTISTIDFDNFIEYYKSKKSCPQMLYVCIGEPFKIKMDQNDDSCSYIPYSKSAGTTIIDANGDEVDCHIDRAKTCSKFQKKLNAKQFYFEFGYYKTADEKIEKYFGVATDKEYSDIVIDSDPNDSNFLYATLQLGGNNYNFQVWEDAQNYIWLSDYKITSDNNILVEAFSNANAYYWIGVSGHQKGGETNVGSLTEVNKNEDPQIPNPTQSNFDYERPCDEKDVLKAMKIIGRVVQIAKIIVPLIIIVFGMIDYSKAVLSDDEKATSKATGVLVKRIISGILVFIAPAVINGLLKVVGVIKEDVDKGSYGKCINCILDVNSCGETVVNHIKCLYGFSKEEKVTIEALRDEKDEIQQKIIVTLNNEDTTSVGMAQYEAKELLKNKSLVCPPKIYVDWRLDSHQEGQRVESVISLTKKSDRYDEGTLLTQKEYLEIQKKKTEETKKTNDHTSSSVGGVKNNFNIPYYYQGDDLYQNIEYGGNKPYNALGCGCGYVALSMVLSGLNNDSNINPVTVIQKLRPDQGYAIWEDDNYCAIADNTLNNNALKNYYNVNRYVIYSRKHGLSENESIIRYNQMIDALSCGHPVVLLIPGHYITIVGVDESDAIKKCGDPNIEKRKCGNPSTYGLNNDCYYQNVKVKIHDPSDWNKNQQTYNRQEFLKNYYNYAERCNSNKNWRCGLMYAVAYYK